MKIRKFFSLLLVVALMAGIPASRAHAETNTDTIGTGTIVSIVIQTDATTGISTVLVGLMGESGLVHTVRVSLETAITLNLIIPNAEMIGQEVTIVDANDPTISTTGVINTLTFLTDSTTGITTLTVNLTLSSDGVTVVELSLDLETAITLGLIAPNLAMVGTDIVIDPTLILESQTYGKITSKLGVFFAETLGIDVAVIQAYHDAGVGYGVLAQAAWMAYMMGGDATTFDMILFAKTNHDYSGVVLADGTTVTNWGSLRKAVLTDGKQNLGQIMSGKASTDTTTTTTTTKKGNTDHSNNGKGNDDK